PRTSLVKPRRRFRGFAQQTLMRRRYSTAGSLVAHNQIGEYFIDAGEALSHEEHSVFFQRPHPSGSSNIANFVGPRSPGNSSLQFLIHGQKLVNANPTLLAGVVALITPFTFIERRG